MFHIEDFIKRLEFIMAHFGLSASSFADKVSVQRSSISHLLSGRNKPSLDFVMKVLDIFPELNVYWLLNGTGSYLKNNIDEPAQNKTEPALAPIIEKFPNEGYSLFADKNFSESSDEPAAPVADLIAQQSSKKSIEKIVFFYSDGSFEDYKPSRSK